MFLDPQMQAIRKFTADALRAHREFLEGACAAAQARAEQEHQRRNVAILEENNKR